MTKTRQEIIARFIEGFKQSYDDSKYTSFKAYTMVPSFFAHGERAKNEAAKMVADGLAIWLNENTIGVSEKGRKAFFTREVIDEVVQK
jgi:hypothetical protein